MPDKNSNDPQVQLIRKVCEGIAGQKIFKVPVNVVAYIAQETLHVLAEEPMEKRKKVLTYRREYGEGMKLKLGEVQAWVYQCVEDYFHRNRQRGGGHDT